MDSKDIIIKESSIVQLYDLVINQEDNEFLIGREEIDTYITIPIIGVEAIQLIQKGLTIGYVKEHLDKKFNEDINIVNFIKELIKYDFVKKIDDIDIVSKREKKRILFPKIKQRHVKWLFSKHALIGYSIIILLLTIIFITNNQYIPKPQDLFFHDSITIIIIVNYILGWLLIFKHEIAHLFAAKSLGVEGRFSLNLRLHYLVAETDVTNLLKIPRKKRYIVFLAGIISDLLFSAAFVFLLLLNDSNIIHINNLVYGILKMMVLIEFLSIVWQFRFYMKTDIYYVIESLVKCKNLYDDSKAYIKKIFYKLFNKKSNIDLSKIPYKEMKYIRMYSILFFFGTLITILVFIYYGIPIIIELFLRIIDTLMIGLRTGNQLALLDSILLIIFLGFNYCLVLYLFIRNIKRQRRETKLLSGHK